MGTCFDGLSEGRGSQPEPAKMHLGKFANKFIQSINNSRSIANMFQSLDSHLVIEEIISDC